MPTLFPHPSIKTSSAAKINALVAVSLLSGLCGQAGAIDLDAEGTLTASGFYSLTAAKVLDGSTPGAGPAWNYSQWRCPCAVPNWTTATVHEKHKGLSFDESVVGLQISKEFTPQLSFTTQVVTRSRDAQSAQTGIDWAYGTWQSADTHTKLRAGRMRIPLYYYSDYRYVGYAYPWVRPPAESYSAEIEDYDGFNISHAARLAGSDWTLIGQIWHGRRHDQDNPLYSRIIYLAPTDVTWSRINGISASIGNGIADFRMVLMTMHKSTALTSPNGTATATLVDAPMIAADAPIHLSGVSANVDYHGWIARTEFNRADSDDPRDTYRYFLVASGYRFHTLTTMLTLSKYRRYSTPVEDRGTAALTLRWDFAKDAALKLQFDVTRDRSVYAAPFFGDSRLLSLSLQGVF
jgi:hypothetical protein